MKLQIQKSIHISWLLAIWCFGVVIGVLLVYYASWNYFSSYIWLLVAISLLSPLIVKRYRWMIIIVLASGLLVGLWRGSIARIGLHEYDNYFNKIVEISGKIIEDPDINQKGEMTLRIDQVKIGNHALPNRIFVTVKKQPLKRSDHVSIKGKLMAGFASFSATMYRGKVTHATRSPTGDIAVGVRDWFAERVRTKLSDTESALGLGFLLGLRRALPNDLAEILKIAGLTHVIVASGYNLTILIRFSRRTLSKRSRFLAMLASSILIISFIAITGISPGMSRAGVVAFLSLATWYFGRNIHPFVLIIFVMAMTLLFNPYYGWGDLGWQLSFGAFIGVIILAPILQKLFYEKQAPNFLVAIIFETFSAQVITACLIIATFGVFSNVALLANILILPLVPLAMLLVFLLGIFVYIPIVSDILAFLTSVVLQYMITVATFLAKQPWSQTEINLDFIQMAIIYIVMVGVIFWLQRIVRADLAKVNIVA